MGFPLIEKFLREEKHYPSKKVVVVEMMTTKDNKFHYYEASIGKDEAELIKYIKFALNSKLSQHEKDKLWDLIETYGQEKYVDGSNDVHMENAGAEY
jgi:hypothetical protein